ncbi:MAG: SLBB domain-containing protein [Candidatus Cloacimonetes bacterium]|nr:SLBB domain-containing protein [Candidatus Cloacimonadota bacterium]
MKNIYKVVLVLAVLLSSICLFAQEDNGTQYSSDIMYNVSVVGAVKNPGVYMFPPTSRVSEAIKLANTLLDTLNVPVFAANNASKRNITLKRNGEIIKLDLLKFLVLGIENSNPYLEDGDIIVVPAIKKQAHVFGAVSNRNDEDLQNSIELKDEDKVLDIIELAMGIMPSADKQNAELVRFIGNSSETESFNLDLSVIINNPECNENLVLQNNDRIYIREIPQYHNKSYVTLIGEITYDGTYAIENNKTTLLQIITKAGGPTEDADLFNAYLQRISEEDISESEYEQLRKTRADDMSHLEYRYFRNKLTEKIGVFAKNFDPLWSNKEIEYDISLKDRDVIYFPAKTVAIKISGEVANPGLISHDPELNYLEYIELAGGLTGKAWEINIKIIRAKTGEWIKPNKNTKLYPGDTIFIPRKERFSYYWPYIQETIAFITGLATSIIVIRSLLAN